MAELGEGTRLGMLRGPVWSQLCWRCGQTRRSNPGPGMAPTPDANCGTMGSQMSSMLSWSVILGLKVFIRAKSSEYHWNTICHGLQGPPFVAGLTSNAPIWSDLQNMCRLQRGHWVLRKPKESKRSILLYYECRPFPFPLHSFSSRQAFYV